MADLEPDALDFRSVNNEASSTILLIHGMFGSCYEFTEVAKDLAEYHLIIPSYYNHGSTSTSPVRSMSLASTTAMLADLIQRHAKNARCHVVGVSLGAHLALHIASTRPNLVESVFASGLQDWPMKLKKWQKSLAPYGLLLDSTSATIAPKFMVGWGPPPEAPRSTCLAAAQDGFNALDESLKSQGSVGKRCMILCATKRGILPTNDSITAAKMWTQRVGEGGSARLVEVKDCSHAWHFLSPKPFAECTLAWIKESEMPSFTAELSLP